MTGHPGERRNRSVALVTTDLRIYHRLVPVFEARGIPLLGLAPDEEIPDSVQVLLDGPNRDPRSTPVRDNDEATLLAALQRLDPRPTAAAEGGYREVVFGVDPGETIGLAVVVDGAAILVAEEHDAIAATRRLAHWMTGLDATSFRVHVGDGAPAIGARIMGAVAEQLPTAFAAYVPEQSTTPRTAATGSRHADAAVHIALRRP